MDISFSENDGVAADLDSASIPLNIQGGFDFGRSAHGFALNVVDLGAVAYKVVPVQVVSQSAAGRRNISIVRADKSRSFIIRCDEGSKILSKDAGRGG